MQATVQASELKDVAEYAKYGWKCPDCNHGMTLNVEPVDDSHDVNLQWHCDTCKAPKRVKLRFSNTEWSESSIHAVRGIVAVVENRRKRKLEIKAKTA